MWRRSNQNHGERQNYSLLPLLATLPSFASGGVIFANVASHRENVASKLENVASNVAPQTPYFRAFLADATFF